jgi:hypothetical protein
MDLVSANILERVIALRPARLVPVVHVPFAGPS